MLSRKNSLRASLTNFKEDVGSVTNGVRAAIQNRRRRTQESSSSQQHQQDMTLGTEPVDPSHYSLGDHMEYIHLNKDFGGHYYCDITHMMCDSVLQGLVKDYCSPITEEELDKLYYGLTEIGGGVDQQIIDAPVRTMAMRLAPGIMSAAILDVLQETCEAQKESTMQVLKRLQGQFKCLLLPEDSSPPIILDARICTERSGKIERHLLLRLFYAEKNTGKPKSPSSKQVRAEAIQNIHSQDLMVPTNLQLRSTAAFLQFLGTRPNPSAIPSPKATPKASTAYFLSSFTPSISIQLHNELPNANARTVFPSLNSEDWSFLQSSWTIITSLWKELKRHNCLFLTFRLSKSKKGPPVVLDLHYCSQIRQIARDQMLADLEQNLSGLRQNLDNNEKSFQIFQSILKNAMHRYSMPRLDDNVKPAPRLKTPMNIPPIGYVKLAQMVGKCITIEEGKPAAELCDETVLKIFKTFSSQDDAESRKYLKDSNKLVMQRLIEIQDAQRKGIREIERHPNAQTGAKEFGKLARTATNTEGRVDRLLLAKVPLLEFDLVSGKCQITATNLVCWTGRVFGNSKVTTLVDLKAVHFEVVSSNVVAVISNRNPSETIVKLHSSTDMSTLTYFIKTLQLLQESLDLGGVDPSSTALPSNGTSSTTTTTTTTS